MPHQFIDDIKRVIETSLPASSAIVSKVINTICSSSSSAKNIAEIIEHDPPLTAKILKVANSAFYGTSGSISSLQRAIVVLGFDTVKELVMTISVVDGFNHGNDISDIDRLGLWYHSIGTAKACQLIAMKTSIERPEVAYLVGLLHDIGKILLAISFPREYSNVVGYAAMQNTRIILAERKLLNTDHTMIGNILCDIWVLPEDINTAILYHHAPMEVSRGSQRLARIVELGDYLCRKAEIGNPGDKIIPEPSHATLRLLGQDKVKIKKNITDIFRKLSESKRGIDEIFASRNIRQDM